MSITTLLKSIIGTLVVFAVAYSQGDEKPNAMPENRGPFAKLNLTDAQKKDIEKLNTDFAKQRVEHQAKIKTATIDLRQLMRADAPDRAAIEKKINEISDLQAQNRIKGVDHWFAVNKLLTPDQQKVWKTMLDRTPGQRLAKFFRNMRERLRSHRSDSQEPHGDSGR